MSDPNFYAQEARKEGFCIVLIIIVIAVVVNLLMK